MMSFRTCQAVMQTEKLAPPLPPPSFQDASTQTTAQTKALRWQKRFASPQPAAAPLGPVSVAAQTHPIFRLVRPSYGTPAATQTSGAHFAECQSPYSHSSFYLALNSGFFVALAIAVDQSFHRLSMASSTGDTSTCFFCPPPPSTASCPAAVRATSFSSTYQSPAIFGSTFDHGILRPTHSPLRHRTGACPRVLGLRLCTLHRHHLCPLAGLSRWTLMRSNIWSRCLVIVTTIELLLSAQTFPHLGTHSRPLRPAGLSHFTSPQKAEDG